MSREKNDSAAAAAQKLVADLCTQHSVNNQRQESYVCIPSRRSKEEEMAVATALYLASAPDVSVSVFSMSGRQAAAQLEAVKKILAEEKNKK